MPVTIRDQQDGFATLLARKCQHFSDEEVTEFDGHSDNVQLAKVGKLIQLTRIHSSAM